MSNHITHFERIRRVSSSGSEFWSSQDFFQALGYTDYRNFEAVVEKARTACFNSGQRVEDHFVGVTEMIEIGKGGQRAVKTVMMSRYACYLVIQNADPAKEVVALGQTYFAVPQAEDKLRREKIAGKDKANRAHHEVGAKVRQTIKELGGAMPESLPAAESTKRLVPKAKTRRLKQGGKA